MKCQPKNNVTLIFTVEGNLNPALSDEDAMIEEFLEEVDPRPTPEDGWTIARCKKKERWRG